MTTEPQPGTNLGPYEIEEPIGAGGMGRVYRARDTRLGRIVALKILAPSIAADVPLKRRFLREARAISALSHSNICALYDIGQDGGLDFLVMEYLEGETLAERLTRGPLTDSEALEYAAQIASALEWAHRRGIIHRDLKPGNIMLTRSGAKLLDFGLARFTENESAAVQPLTDDGAIVGTIDYMAPEQLSGGTVDARADLFSLGVIMYEMLAGSRPFAGHNRASVIASILFSNPQPLHERRADVARGLERIVAACLEKTPDERIQTAHDLNLQLQWLREGKEPLPARPRRQWASRLSSPIAYAVLAVLLVGAAWFFVRMVHDRASHAASPRTISTIDLPPTDSITENSGPVISPDGRYVAFIVERLQGQTAIRLRAIDDVTPRTLPNTAGAFCLEWSPDSRHILFSTIFKIARLDILTGAVTTLADAADSRGMTENAEGDVIYAPSFIGTPLFRIPADGGKPVAITKLRAGETSHRWPQFLPDGRHFLYFAARRDDVREFGQVCVGAIDSSEVRCPAAASSQAIFVAPNIIVFDSNSLVKAYEFDARGMVVKRVVAEMPDIDVYDDNAFLLASASSNGLLTYMARSTRPIATLQWLDRSGKVLQTIAQSSSYESLSLSRDGQKLAVVDNGDIWTLDLQRGVPTRITFGRSIERAPVWSPDGNQIAYDNSRPGHYETRIRPASPVLDNGSLVLDEASPTDWSADGRYLALEAGIAGREQMVIYSVREHRMMPVTADHPGFGSLRFSPDVKSIAYVSNISGAWELYIDSFPKPSGRIQVSSGGASGPRWRGDGKELYFLSSTGRMMAVSIQSEGGRLRIQTPRALFDLGRSADSNFIPYDVSPDGERFVIIRRPETARRPITLMTNWTEILRK